MSTDFEKTKCQLGGHSILITSWYDDQKGNWHASAPSYAHLRVLSPDNRGSCGSRKAAIDQIMDLLARHFAEVEGTSPERLVAS